jgi:GT2 family glycosyltransferase
MRSVQHPAESGRQLMRLARSACLGGSSGGLRNSLAELRSKLSRMQGMGDYPQWITQFDSLCTDDERQAQQFLKTLPLHPLVSVVLPTYQSDLLFLKAAIDSVLSQWYPNLELCVADDCSNSPALEEVLGDYAQRDSRFRYIIRKENGHISAATNSAVAVANGEYVALMDHDDLLRPHALLTAVAYINRFPQARLFYSDEDKITTQGIRYAPHFKPDFNYELLLAQNYICHLAIIRRDACPAFRPGLEGAQDWDLFLRIVERCSPEEIVHIPEILYHWRAIAGSTAVRSDFKPYVAKAQERCITEHCARRNETVESVTFRKDISQIEVRFPQPAVQPHVSIIIVPDDLSATTQRCVSSVIERTQHELLEVLALETSGIRDVRSTQHAAPRLRSIPLSESPDRATYCNSAAREAQGEYLVFLSDSLLVQQGDWLAHLLALIKRPEVGLVGGKILSNTSHVRHAGLVFLPQTNDGREPESSVHFLGVAERLHFNLHSADAGYGKRCAVLQEVSAISSECMLVAKTDFQELGGMHAAEFPSELFALDLCRRVRESGKRILFQPRSIVSQWRETSDRVTLRDTHEHPERLAFIRRWPEVLREDPLYNPNFSIDGSDHALAWPPRIKKVWR